MSNELSMVNSKINEIITILMLQPEFEAPDNYRDLAEYLVRFNLQKSPDPLESIFSMVATFESNRDMLEEDEEDYEFFDESGGEPDNGDFLREGLEETGGSYSDNESFYREFGDKPLDDEAEQLSAHYNQKYYKEHENSSSCSHSTLTPVENNVVLGLIIQIKKDVGGYNEEFLTTMQYKLQLVGFSTPQVWEIMTQHLNPESKRFNSADIQHILQQESGNSHEHN
jgi:hypothetical protein